MSAHVEADAPWDEAAEARLAQLWADRSISTATIGRLMKRSKNAVTAKAHRIGLPARESPIKPGDEARVPPTPAQVERAAAGHEPLAAGHPIARAVLGWSGQLEGARATVPPAAACCWPIGEPGVAGFRFCDAPGEVERSYCAEHCGKAFVVRRERTAAQAAADQIFALRVRAARAGKRGRYGVGPMVGLT